MKFTAQLPTVRLLSSGRAYFVGIKGVGMASLAILLQQAGLRVGGADSEESFVTDAILALHHISSDTFASAVIPDGTEVVIYSGANQGRNNPLVQEALRKQIPILSQAEALGLLTKQKETLAVAGVGGKSTTSALLAWMLELGDQSASFSIGVGDVPNLGTSGRWHPGSRYFVVEADEYVADPTQDLTPRFLYLQPGHAICTSLSFDHPDVYAGFDDTRKAFAAFLTKLPDTGTLVYNGDQPALAELAESLPGKFQRITVGEHKHNQVRLANFEVVDGQGKIQLQAPGWPIDRLELESRIPGKHNLLNAAYAAALASVLGLPSEKIAAAVASFRSTKRRFEYVGETNTGCRCYDDYAHHPREIKAIGAALRDWFPDKQWVIAFEPHTFSRTKALYQEFLSALSGLSAQVLLLPIFASAREQFDPTITSEMLINDLQKRGVAAEFCPDQGSLLEYIQGFGADTIFLTLGAGTIYKVFEHVAWRSTPEPLS